MTTRNFSTWGLPLFAFTCSLATPQAALLQIDGTVPNAALGESTSSAGDVDGDGVEDLLLGMPADPSANTFGGSAIVASGTTGDVLYRFEGSDLSKFGSDGAGLGDVNGDGRDDFAIGAPEDSTFGFKRGVVRVYSGIDGSIIHEIQGPRINGFFGTELINMGDLDGDEVNDLAVGARAGALGPIRGKGSVLLHSGATGALIRAIEGPFDDSQYGTTVANAGDFDGDGLGDILVGAPREQSLLGAVRVHSSADGSLLFEVLGTLNNGYFGAGAAALPDFNGDGVPEVVVGQTTFTLVQGYSGADATLLWETEPIQGAGFVIEPFVDWDGDGAVDFLTNISSTEVWIRSGATGEQLTGTPRDVYISSFPRNQVTRLGDVDGDGHVDFAVGASSAYDFPSSGLARLGTVYIFSGAPPIQTTICSNGSLAARLFAQGSDDPAENRLTLTATAVRNDAFGYFITSLGTDVVVQPGGAFTDVCISDPVAGIGRHLESLSQAGIDRAHQFELDLDAIPSPAGTIAVLAGQTRNWQHWSRSVNPFGTPISIFSDAIAVDFQ